MSIKPDTSSRSPGVMLSVEQWRRLCTALNIDPANDIDSVIAKASALQDIVQRRPTNET
jgi:hypothetical protein